ncbi:helix-turn-helix domain-containing protein [Nocardia blacklockiae]|uniref:helix-turn-helix domain-containing protein n=1 Tax=Nocardia blacklockiae TaxID=480036 RepID=UPI0018952CF9|nr:helix-turn-helix transcriptional regulator [Nocardia blacklockiae]MBF6174652.1 helix-turn-helix domain-containing protein [Nocardia blacklockiae]
MSVAGSTLARRALGRELRRLRLEKGMYQAEAARLAETSAQSISRFEEGRSTRITSLQVNALCDAYGATDEERRILLGLVQEIRATREYGGRWWRAYVDAETPEGFDHYLSLEEAASRLTAWKTTIIPGLLQTPEYRRALAWSEVPQLSPEAIEGRLEIAAHRQLRLNDPDFRADILLSEAVLHDQVGGPGVMKHQLHHLAKVAERQNVSLRIVPYASATHLGSLTGSFILLEFPNLPQSKLNEPPIVYVEGYVGDLYLERESEVRRYRAALAEIARVASGSAQSRQLILDALREYE